RAEIVEQRLATPGRLDDQHRPAQLFVERETERKLGPDLSAVLARLLSRSVAGGQLAEAFAVFVAAAGKKRGPHMVADLRPPVGIAHLRQQRSRLWIVADVIERLDLRVSLHVRLTGEDEHL